MSLFSTTLINVIITLLYILPGFYLAKKHIMKTEHTSALSAILVYICAPCMVVSSFTALPFSTVTLKNMGIFFLATLILQGLFTAILYLLLRRKYDDARYRIFTIGSVMGNVGFFGRPIVTALFGATHPEVACYSVVFTVSMNMIIYTVGIYCLTNDKKHISLKSSVWNPVGLGVLIGLPLFLIKDFITLPGVLATAVTQLGNAVNLVGSMSTPLIMFMLGIRLANVSLANLFRRPFIYLTCLMKLVVFPLFCYLLVLPFPFDPVLKASILVLASVPGASVVSSLAELYKSEQELAANVLLLTTLLCFITMPLVTLILPG